MNFYRKLTRAIPFQYCMVVLLAIAYASVNEIFVFQNKFAPAGVMGLATLVQEAFHFNVAYLYLFINVPLLIVAFFVIKRQFAIRTLLFVLTSSAAFFILREVGIEKIAFVAEDTGGKLLAAIAAGFFNGMIYIMLVWNGACTGGTDIVAALINHKHPETNVIWLIFSLNAAVVALSFFVYQNSYQPVLLCIAYIFVFSRVGDAIFKGSRSAVKFEVVTTHPEEITRELFATMRHGCTAVRVRGEYSHTDRSMLVCVINRREIADFERIIRKYDDTFAYFSGVNRIVGSFNRFGKGTQKAEDDSEKE
ncbi:MAG: YitT family protein [Ruminococcaceae bacterium]|nr:YitT family protein [Oscillospiraceae bacterium]